MSGQSFNKDLARNASDASNATMNATDLRSKNSPTISQAGELYEGLNRVPASSSGETQATAGSSTMYSSNNNLYANNYMGNQTLLNVSTPLFDPAITPAMAMTGQNNSTVTPGGVLVENGTEYSMIPSPGDYTAWHFCYFCNLPFHDKKTLHYHNYFAHILNRTIFVCPLCGETFQSNVILQQHMQQRHPHQCLFCHIQFETSTHLANHIFLCHPNGSFTTPTFR